MILEHLYRIGESPRAIESDPMMLEGRLVQATHPLQTTDKSAPALCPEWRIWAGGCIGLPQLLAIKGCSVHQMPFWLLAARLCRYDFDGSAKRA